MKKSMTFFFSSLGKKVLMSLTGLFLVVFLVEHLVGNLLLFANDHGARYEEYSAFLVSNPIIRFIEIFLFLAIIGHAILAAFLKIKNRMTRPVKYKSFRLKDNTPLASRTTLWTGSVIFIFLVIHLRSFFIPSRFGAEKISAYELVVQVFANPLYDLFYLVALLLLGYHLRHGFQSAFQSLGLRNTKYAPIIDTVGFIVWFLIPLGFATIPIYFYYQQAVSGAILGVH